LRCVRARDDREHDTLGRVSLEVTLRNRGPRQDLSLPRTRESFSSQRIRAASHTTVTRSSRPSSFFTQLAAFLFSGFPESAEAAATRSKDSRGVLRDSSLLVCLLACLLARPSPLLSPRLYLARSTTVRRDLFQRCLRKAAAGSRASYAIYLLFNAHKLLNLNKA
jgi:hypothetical protein